MDLLMKVIMLRSNPIDPDVRIEKEAKTLVNAGYDVLLLGWKRFGDAPKIERRSGYIIRRIKFLAPLEIKVIFYLPFWWILALNYLLREEWDIAHAADLDTYIPALLAAKLKRKKIIYDIFDFYADEILLPSIIQRCVAKLDTTLMKFADAIIIVDPSRLKQIKRENDDSIHIIYNTPQDFFCKNMENDKKKSQFVVFFAGILSHDRGFETIIEVAKQVNGLRIEIAGFGYYEKKLLSLIENEPNIIFIGKIPYHEVIRKTIKSDLLIALYNPDITNNRFASPNKLFEAMMCGKPIIVSDGTAMADIVRHENCGIVVPYGDIKALKQEIIMLKNNPEICIQLGKNGRMAYLNKYNWNLMEEKLIKIYQNFKIS